MGILLYIITVVLWVILTPFEKEKLRPKMALLFYFSNDTLENGLCGYNTTPNDWEIV